MIQTAEGKLYTATEVSLCLGITRKTLGTYSKTAGIPDRRIQRVRYYSEGEIQTLLRISREIHTRKGEEERV